MARVRGGRRVRIRRVEPHEWEALRALRLRALATDPTAFGRTYAEESALPDAGWRERAAQGAAGLVRVMLVAEDEGRLVGMAGAWRMPDGASELYGMWVAPEARRRGLARGLIDGAASWARGVGASPFFLWVEAENEGARRAYERCGFVAVGEPVPGARDPTRRYLRMERRAG